MKIKKICKHNIMYLYSKYRVKKNKKELVKLKDL